MVHKAFREALGETATQAGSENAPGRFRFDFSATGAVPESVMADVEARVNEVVLDDLAVEAEIMSQAEAVKSGAMALFGEKYGDKVRVVSVGDWARELCGGTHAGSSGKLGVIKLLRESSIGSGVRRVEALVGSDAYRFLAREHVLVDQLAEALKARPRSCPSASTTSSRSCARPRRRSRRSASASCWPRGGQLAAGAARSAAVNVVAHRADGAGGGDVRTLALDVRGRLPQGEPGVVVVIGAADGKVSVVAALNDAAQARGLSANDLVRAVGPLVGGKGGGKADVAQGGGTDASRIDEALASVAAEVAASGQRSDAPRRTPRHRPRRRPDRRGAQRPDRLPRHPGRDRTPRQGRPRAARGASSPRTEARGGRRGPAAVALRRRGPGGGEGARVRRARWPARVAPVPVRLSTSG